MSLDEILYQVRILPPVANDEGEKTMLLVGKVISQLPDDIQEKVLSEITFIVLDGVYGQYERLFIPMPEVKKDKHGLYLPAIFLNMEGLKRRSEEYKKTVIAHEIAHFILNHHNAGDDLSKEKQADDLCESWGFGRGYKEKDYDI